MPRSVLMLPSMLFSKLEKKPPLLLVVLKAGVCPMREVLRVNRLAFCRNDVVSPANTHKRERTRAAMAQRRGRIAEGRILWITADRVLSNRLC